MYKPDSKAGNAGIIEVNSSDFIALAFLLSINSSVQKP